MDNPASRSSEVKKMENEENIVRIDKWLWAARLFKTRSLAVDAIKVIRGEFNRLDSNALRTSPGNQINYIILVLAVVLPQFCQAPNQYVNVK